MIVDENAGNIPEWANAWGLSGASNVYGKDFYLLVHLVMTSLV